MGGGPRPALLQDRINYQVLGANVWRHASSIRAMSDKSLRLYLSNTSVGSRYALTTTVQSAPVRLAQTIDFADRTTSNNLSPQGAIEERVDSPTRLVFVSEPFEQLYLLVES
jgi:uncharacterized protein